MTQKRAILQIFDTKFVIHWQNYIHCSFDNECDRAHM